MMLRHTLFFLLGAWSALASATEKLPQTLSSDAALLQGHMIYQQWLSDGDKRDIKDLLKANSLYNIASKEHRYDYRFQINQYLVNYALAWEDWNKWHVALEENYANLDPLFTYEVNHPGIVELRTITSLSHTEHIARKLALFKKILRENPESAYSWYLLSKYFERLEHYELALEAAKVSSKLIESSAEINFQIGNLYYFLWAGHSCDRDGRSYAIRAVPYFVKASTLLPESSFFANRLSHIYKVLGVYPMAINVGEKALALDENLYTLRDLAEATMLDGQYQRAEKYYLNLVGKHKETKYYYQLAKIDIANRNFSKFGKDYKKATKAHSSKSLQRLIHYELLKKYDQKEALKFLKKHSLHWNFYESFDEDVWSRWTMQYMSDVISKKAYFEKAVNDCQKGKAHFYHALSLWDDNHRIKAVCALKRSMTLGSTFSDEYDWAKVLIDSKLIFAVTPNCGELEILQLAEKKTEYPDAIDDFMWALNNAEGYHGDIDYKAFQMPEPKYPVEANKMGAEGYAIVSLSINEGGFVEAVELQEELPEGAGFGFSAIEAARQLRFFPKVEGGIPVPVDNILFKYNFTGFTDNGDEGG